MTMTTQHIQLRAVFSRPAVAAETGGTVFLLLQVEAGTGVSTGAGGAAGKVDAVGRAPLNVAAVLDRSGSMAGAKLEYAKRALDFLVTQLGPGDRLAAVAYDDEVGVLWPSAPVSHRQRLRNRLRDVEPCGMTNLGGGLVRGIREVLESRVRLDAAAPEGAAGGAPRGATVLRVILLSDGLANVGVTDPVELRRMAAAAREEGVLVTTMGVGDDFDEDLLAGLAEEGGGNFYFIENPDRIPAIFAQELEGLLSVVGQGIRVRVAAPEGVRVAWVDADAEARHAARESAYRGRPAAERSLAARDIPDLYSNEVRPLLLALDVAPGRAGEERRLEVELACQDVRGGGVEARLRVTPTLTLRPRAEVAAMPENEEVRKELALARAARALEEAILHADLGDFTRALAHVSVSREELAAFGDDERVALRAASLAESAEALRSFGPAARKRMRMHARQSRTGRHQRER